MAPTDPDLSIVRIECRVRGRCAPCLWPRAPCPSCACSSPACCAEAPRRAFLTAATGLWLVGQDPCTRAEPHARLSPSVGAVTGAGLTCMVHGEL